MVRRGEGGLTLIEILLSLIVMILGISGILALFPSALQSSRESVEDTEVARIVESVAHSAKTAMQYATYDPATQDWVAVMTHDLKNSDKVVRFVFRLPRLNLGTGDTEWRHYPNAGDPDGGKVPGDPETDPHFESGGDQWVVARVNQVEELRDEKLKHLPNVDPYKNWAFSFRVGKINTLRYLHPNVTQPPPVKPGTQNDPYTWTDIDILCKLFEFQVNVFRLAFSSTAVTKQLLGTATHRVTVR